MKFIIRLATLPFIFIVAFVADGLCERGNPELAKQAGYWNNLKLAWQQWWVD